MAPLRPAWRVVVVVAIVGDGGGGVVVWAARADRQVGGGWVGCSGRWYAVRFISKLDFHPSVLLHRAARSRGSFEALSLLCSLCARLCRKGDPVAVMYSRPVFSFSVVVLCSCVSCRIEVGVGVVGVVVPVVVWWWSARQADRQVGGG